MLRPRALGRRVAQRPHSFPACSDNSRQKNTSNKISHFQVSMSLCITLDRRYGHTYYIEAQLLVAQKAWQWNEFHDNVRGEVRVNLLALFASKFPHFQACCPQSIPKCSRECSFWLSPFQVLMGHWTHLDPLLSACFDLFDLLFFLTRRSGCLSQKPGNHPNFEKKTKKRSRSAKAILGATLRILGYSRST